MLRLERLIGAGVALVAGLVGAGAGVACGDGRDRVVSFDIGLTLDPSLWSSCWVCQDPDDCPLDCGGQVGLYAVDPVSDELLSSACVDFAFTEGRRLRDLASEKLLGGAVLANLAAGRAVAIEVAVFDFPPRDRCPRVRVSPDFGIPVTEDGTAPWYFGRSEVVTLDEALDRVVVPLGCVTNSMCGEQPQFTTVTAQVTELHSLVVPDAPTSIDVRLGSVFLIFGGSGPAHAQVNVGPSLQLVDDPFPRWHKTFEDGIFIDPSCVGTIVTRVPASASTFSCEGWFGFDHADAQGYLVDKTRLDRILAALALPSLPNGGLLVGRVVDLDGNPVADATVRPSGAGSTAQVSYFTIDEGDPGNPDDDVWTRTTTATGPNGYFAVTEATLTKSPWLMEPMTARCCEAFEATVPSGALGMSNSVVGLVDGVVTATVITVAP